MSTRWTAEDLQRKGIKIAESLPVVKKQSNQPASYALGRLPGRQMNKTELAYSRRLETLKQIGEVLWYAFEPINLRIGDKCFYAVDFFVMVKSGELECHEIKGFWEGDALVKIKAAAAFFPFKFKAFKLVKGDWEVREF